MPPAPSGRPADIIHVGCVFLDPSLRFVFLAPQWQPEWEHRKCLSELNQGVPRLLCYKHAFSSKRICPSCEGIPSFFPCQWKEWRWMPDSEGNLQSPYGCTLMTPLNDHRYLLLLADRHLNHPGAMVLIAMPKSY